MKDAESPEVELTPSLLLRAYAAGVFPMADSADSDEVFWVDPRKRGILPIERFHLSRSLRKRVLRGDYTVGIDRDFSAVLQACADRPETWINPTIRALYRELYRHGHAHSVEVRRDGTLIGGLYGVRLRGAFFGESMFTRAPDGSKIALCYLIARLRHGGFTLLDTQFTTEHLERMGALTVSRARYHELLDRALARPADFYSLPEATAPSEVVQLITQTSKRG